MKKYTISFNSRLSSNRKSLIIQEIMDNPQIEILVQYSNRLIITLKDNKNDDIPAIITYAMIVGDIEFNAVSISHILSRLFEDYVDRDKSTLYHTIKDELKNQGISQYDIRHTKDFNLWYIAYIEDGKLRTYFDTFTMEV